MMKISNILVFQGAHRASPAAPVLTWSEELGWLRSPGQAASLLELGAHFPLSGEQDRSLCAALGWVHPCRGLLEPAMDRAAPDRVGGRLKIPSLDLPGYVSQPT